MASPKKKATNPRPFQRLSAFAAGLFLPVCLVLAWHAAYGQQHDAPGKLETASVTVNAPSALPPPAFSEQDEFNHMRQLFQTQVFNHTLERLERTKKMWAKSPKIQQIMDDRRHRLLSVDKPYLDAVREDVRAQLKATGLRFEASQYFVWADRNPSSQIVLVGFYDARQNSIDFLGADLMSSGNLEKGGDYFITPVGIFENTVDNFSYRAQGTPNQEGWRGLGGKDSRVWDFGYQKSLKKYKGGNTMSEMRLLMHATDPEKGEPRLGRTDSKGCVRISQYLNRFLDTYAVLDRHYEEWAKNKPSSWLLKKDRQPVGYPGLYLFIGEIESRHMAASAKP